MIGGDSNSFSERLGSLGVLNMRFERSLNFSTENWQALNFLGITRRTATSVFLCARRPCGRSGTRTLETRKRDCAGWTKGFGGNVSRKANYESEGPKKKNEILYYLKNEMKNEI